VLLAAPGVLMLSFECRINEGVIHVIGTPNIAPSWCRFDLLYPPSLTIICKIQLDMIKLLQESNRKLMCYFAME